LIATTTLAAPPQIIQQPQRRDVNVGMTAVFRVDASGAGPLAYQWHKNSEDIVDATDPTLELENVQLSDAANYIVTVYDGAESTISSAATLNVTGPLMNRALSLDGSGDSAQVASNARIQNADALTIEFWVFPLPSVVNQFGSFINKGDGLSATSSRTYEFRWQNDGTMSVNLFLVHIDGQPDAAGFGLDVPEHQWSHVAATFDSATGVVAGYVNGQEEFTTTMLNGFPVQGRTIRQSSPPLVVGVTPGFSNTQATGRIDEVRIWDRARSALEIAADYSCKLTGAETGLVGYWPFDDGGADDFTVFEQHGTLAGDAHTDLISEGDLPVSGCGQPTFVYTSADLGQFKTSIKHRLDASGYVESTTDWQTWRPAGSLPNATGRQTVTEDVEPGSKFFRASSR